MNTEAIKSEAHKKGYIYTFAADNRPIAILYSFHAIDRMEKWQLSAEQVDETMIFPEEVVSGHRGRYIAHRRYDDHLVRAVYEYENQLPILITVYFPYSQRYFSGGGRYEDRIL